MNQSYSHTTIDGNISHWTFLETATAETFQEAFGTFNEAVHLPEIDRLVVEVRMPDSFLSKDIQEIWLQTGEIAQSAGILKWGVVADGMKLSALRFLVRGGIEGERTYEYFLSESLEEVLAWIVEPCEAVPEPVEPELVRAAAP